MTEDHVLRELGHLAKEEVETEQGRLDERWDRLAAGTLSAEEEAELRTLAESSPEAREAYEAFRPLGADFQARMVGALAAEIAAPPAAETREPRARVLPFRPATLRFAGWLTAAAAAAGLLVLLRGPATMPPLPVYSAELSGGVREFRGETDTRPVFTPGSPVTVVVRPEHPVTGEVEARAYLIFGDEWRLWEPVPEVSNGAVRLRGEASGPGDWRLWVVVGRPGRIPPLHELRFELLAGRIRHEDWQAVPVDLRVLNALP